MEDIELPKKTIFQTDEKGRYYTMKFDAERGIQFDTSKQKMYNSLKEKYGRKNKC